MFLDSKHQRECNDNKVEKSLLTLCIARSNLKVSGRVVYITGRIYR